MQIKLAEALLRRKELQQKLVVLTQFKQNQLVYEVRGQRLKVTDSFDEFSGTLPKLELNQVTAEYDLCARQLRLIDGAIQQVNWTAEVTVNDIVMEDFKDRK